MNELCSRTTTRDCQKGFSLMETMIACFVLLVGVTGLMALFTVAAVRNANQGDQATRTTEYAQDKMEQLMALDYGDTTSNTTTVPTTPAGCTGCGLSLAGSLTSNDTYFSDFIDKDGQVTTTQSSKTLYIRRWKIEETQADQLKTITVKVMLANKFVDMAPSTTLICRKAAVKFQ
jgi:Tfp pilus assembly protein PilV